MQRVSKILFVPIVVIAQFSESTMKTLCDGNPLDDVTMLLDYRNNLKRIMQEGTVPKNSVVATDHPDYKPWITSVADQAVAQQ